MDEHIQKIEKLFGKTSSKLAKLNNVDRAWIDVCLVKSDEEKNESHNTSLSVESICTINRLALPIELTFYGVSK